MASFIGEYEVAVDAKGRFLAPASFRKQLAEGEKEQFIVKRGFESCLDIYPLAVWQKISDKLSKMNDLVEEVRDFKRVFMNGATMVDLDSADRMLIPKHLQEYAGIKKDAVLAAQGTRMELWDKDTYQNYMKQKTVDVKALTEKVTKEFGNPFAD